MAFPPHILPPSTPPLSGGAPEPAPPGTIFVIGDEHGWAVPPRKFTLHFGREEDEVHVPLGVDDDHIGREHGVLECDGQQWWLENRGKLPIQVPNGPMLLRGHGWTVPTGYTPLMISSGRRRTHILNVLVVGHRQRIADRKPTVRTKNPEFYTLSRKEHSVLAALAQHYLRGEPCPQPATWADTAAMLNRPGGKQWTAHRVENLVSRIRGRLSIPFTCMEEVRQPVGNILNHNLIQALLRSGCLLPEDLEQFETEPEDCD